MKRLILLAALLALITGTAASVDTPRTEAYLQSLFADNTTGAISPQDLRDFLVSVDMPFNVRNYGAVGDGVTDDTAAIQAAIDACEAAGGGEVFFPNATYEISGTILTVEGPITLRGDKATLLLAPGSYSSHLYMIGTRTSTAYDAGTPYEENITIEGLIFDGNIGNITTTASSLAIVAHQVRDFTVRDCIIKDMPGTMGGGYGISFWYSDRVRVENVHIDRTDRQNIMIWEVDNAVIDGCVLKDSYFRDCIAIGSTSPPLLQSSYATVQNTSISNALTGGVNRGLRFSGSSSGVVDNCRIENCDATGLAILDVYYHDIKVTNTIIANNGAEGIYIASNTDKSIIFNNCEIDSNTDSVYVNTTGGTISFDNCKFRGNTGTLRVEFVDDIRFTNNYVSGGGYVSIRPTVFARVSGNYFTGITNASYAVLLGGDDTVKTHFDNNIVTGNTVDKVYSLQSGRMYGNILDSINAGNMEFTFNVRDFGAKGDGVQDDTAAIQAAIDACNTAGGGIVFLPAGTYAMSSIYLNGLLGAGEYDNIVIEGIGANTVLFQLAGSDDDMFLIRRSTNITFRNLKFDGNASNQNDGANSFYGGDNSCIIIARDINSVGSSAGVQEGQIRVEDCYFYNWFWCAMNISSDSWGLTVANCFFDGNNFTGGDTYHFAINNQCKQFSITGNQIRNIDGGGIYFEGDDTTLNEATYTSVDGFGYCGGNQVENCLWGIRSQNLGIAHSIVGNQIRDCESGIALDASGLSQSGESDWQHQNVVADNVVRNITTSTLDGSGIVMINQRSGTVSGNSVENAITGIRVTASEKLSVTGNNIRKCKAIGLRISDSSELAVSGNTITDNMQSASGTHETGGSEAGITLFSSGSTATVLISGNVISDTQSVPTQPYGVLLYHSISGVRVYNNMFVGNTTAAISDRLATSGVIISHEGIGTPEAAQAAGVGSTFHRTDGGAGTTLYVKESGTGNTGWVAK